MRSRFVLTMFIATASCMELTKLEEESSDPIALADLASNAPSDEQRSTYINQDQSTSERQNFAHCGADASFRPVAHEHEAEYHVRQEFTNLIKDSPLKDLHPKKLCILLRAWERKSDQVLLLATDSEEILNQQKFEELLLDNSRRHQTGEVQRLGDYSRDLCVKIKDRLELLKEKKLLELGGLDSLSQNQETFELLKSNYNEDRQMAEKIGDNPRVISKIIMKVTYEKIAQSILDDIKQIIIDQKSLPKHRETSGEKALVPAVKYLLKTMDFLYTQGFMKGEDVRTYVLHDNNAERDTIHYTLTIRFADEKYIKGNDEQIWIGGESVTNHWYFSPMHKVFEVFGEKDKEIITLYSLEAKIIELGTKLQQSHQTTQEFQENWTSFSVQEYINTLNKVMNRSNQRNKSPEKGMLKMEISVDEKNQMELQIKKMLQLLQELDLNPELDAYDHYYENWLDITNASLLYISICQLIDFTERNISRDIVAEIEAEKIQGGFVESRALRHATLSSTKLVQYTGFTRTLVYLIYGGKDKIYLSKNEAYLESKIQEYLGGFSQEIIKFNENHQLAGLDQTIFNTEVDDFLHRVTVYKGTSTKLLEASLKLESLGIRRLSE
ncbi:hypothetical protein PSTG_07709 [Puccinia striiformis f. sp. tritici PST-78]|uniref:Uncharacterized protein n=1 Tax=Puccinia striiformis f. sp. tritici PST-78 TaxID=1165861 RepID=A0A0L0VIH0_9BASI|nr:hypothetical protein PSTG_07709 [Puccinia striiformis f. sp. tritici PST-78]